MPASFLMIMTAATAPNIDCHVGIGGFRTLFGDSPSGGGSWLKTSGGLASAFVFAEDIADEKSDDNSPDSPWKIFHHDSLAFLLLPPSVVQKTLQDTTPILMSFRNAVRLSFETAATAAPSSNHLCLLHHSRVANQSKSDGRAFRLRSDGDSGLSAVSAPVGSTYPPCDRFR